MKILKILTTIIALLSILFYLYEKFGDTNGKKYEVDSTHHVFYKGDGLTKDDAKNVGDYFKRIGYFKTGSEVDVQISAEKQKNDLKIAYIVAAEKITAEDDKAYLLISSVLADSVFKSKKMAVSLVNDNLEEIKNLGYTSTQSQVTETKQTDSTNTK